MTRADDAGVEARPRLRWVILLALSVAGLTLCITLVFLGMRSVMDIGGACADGGPFVPVQPCPDGAPAAMVLGILGLFMFGGLTFATGAAVGGAWSGLGILAWTGLFASLGWNFLDYGIISPPEGETVVWGWLIPGVRFEVMAFAPLVIGGGAMAAMRGRAGSARRRVPTSAPVAPGSPSGGGPSSDGGGSSSVGGPRVSILPGPGQPAASARPATVNARPPREATAREALTEVASVLEAASREAQANTSVAEALDPAAAPTPAFQEGTQALLDRLERLADMRAQNLLDAAEYETAKDLVLRELEARRA